MNVESQVKTYRMYIGGEWVDAIAGGWFDSENPFTGRVWARVPRARSEDVDRVVAASRKAFRGPWSRMTASARGLVLHRFGDLIALHADRLARTEVRDNGKLFAEMKAQLDYIPNWFRYYGGLADKIEGAVIPTDKLDVFNYTRHEPLGVVVAITAWNSPLMLLAYKLAPALAAGNTVVVKPSEFTSCSALELMELVAEAGFPPGVINVVTGYGAEMGDALVGHPDVAKIAFTGSDRTGQRIYETAARSIKPVTLELGGKSPNIVFADARLDDAVNGIMGGIFAAAGQTCAAGSRLLVHRSIAGELVDRVVEGSRTIRMGDPMEATTQLGPISNRPQFERVMGLLDVARAEGAEVRLGGGRSTLAECGDGLFVEPTVLTGVSNDMRIAREEVFGPVLSVIPFDDDDEAVAIANDSMFGLAAGVWTQDYRRMLHMAERLQAGTVWINTYRAVSYLSPFGGYKRSGLGREMGPDAIRAYLQTKSVWISTAEQQPSPFVIR